MRAAINKNHLPPDKLSNSTRGLRFIVAFFSVYILLFRCTFQLIFHPELHLISVVDTYQLFNFLKCDESSYFAHAKIKKSGMKVTRSPIFQSKILLQKTHHDNNACNLVREQFNTDGLGLCICLYI